MRFRVCAGEAMRNGCLEDESGSISVDWLRVDRRVGRFLVEAWSESEAEKSSLLSSLYDTFTRLRLRKSSGAMIVGAI